MKIVGAFLHVSELFDAWTAMVGYCVVWERLGVRAIDNWAPTTIWPEYILNHIVIVSILRYKRMIAMNTSPFQRELP